MEQSRRSQFDQPDWADRAESTTRQVEREATEFAEDAQQRTAQFGQEVKDQGQGFAEGMKEKAANFGEQAKDKATEFGHQAKGKAAEFGQQAKEKATEVGGKARDMAQTGKEKVGMGLGTAGEKIRERTENMTGVTGNIGRKVGAGLENTGHYLQETQAGEIWDDVEEYVKKHPVQSVAGAVVAGIIVGRMLK